MITLQRLLCSQYLAIKQDVLSSVSAPERTNLDRRTIVATGSSAKSCVEPQTISGNSRAVSIKQKAARHLLAPSGAKPTPVPPRYTLVSYIRSGILGPLWYPMYIVHSGTLDTLWVLGTFWYPMYGLVSSEHSGILDTIWYPMYALVS